MQTVVGLLLPFVGTALGACFVCFMRGGLRDRIQLALTGFAAGIMTAASVWSLLLPAIGQSESMGKLSFLPPVVGFWLGTVFLQVDRLFPQLREDSWLPGKTSGRTALMVLAVVLHNIPEGMAVGVAFAGLLCHSPGVTAAGAMALSLGIAIQNIPEGAIISMPLHAEGVKKSKSLLYGVLSGAVEPVAAVLTVLAAGFVTPLLPYLLSFAAGAMIGVVVEELIPALSEQHARLGTFCFAAGFTVMLALDVAFG